MGADGLGYAASVATIDLDSASPEQTFRAVAEMDDEEFEQLMAEPASRGKVIDAIVEHMVANFRPEKAEGVDAAIHLKLWDRPEGGYEHFELRIEDGTCELVRQPDNEDPDLTLKVRPTDLRKLVTGETGARRLAFKGRLRVLGDIGLAMKLQGLFGL